jgi:hypothetical protein
MITRKQFFGSVAGLFGVAVLSACSDDGVENPGVDAPRNPDSAGPLPDSALPDAMPQACTTASATIGTNHGHTLAIPPADVEAGVNKSYDITGSSDHPHTVLVTAAMFTMLKTARTLSVTSTNNAGHTHTVTVTC